MNTKRQKPHIQLEVTMLWVQLCESDWKNPIGFAILHGRTGKEEWKKGGKGL